MFTKIFGLALVFMSAAAQIQEGRYRISNSQHPTWSLQTIPGTTECFVWSTNDIPPETVWTVKRSPRSPPGLYGLGNVVTSTFATFDQSRPAVGQTIVTAPSTFGTAFRITPITQNKTFTIGVVGQPAGWTIGPPHRGRAKVILETPKSETHQWLFNYLGPL